MGEAWLSSATSAKAPNIGQESNECDPRQESPQYSEDATWPWTDELGPVEATPLRQEASPVVFWTLFSLGAYVVLRLLTRFIVLLDIGLENCASEHVGDIKISKTSEDVLRHHAVLRVAILACVSFFTGIGLSAMQPAVHSLDWLLL